MPSTNSHKILTDPDVLIVGGGSAGVAAAVGAAEGGASVILLEKNGFLGGKATAAFVGTVCGLYYRSEQPEPRFVSHGFPAAFADQLRERSRAQPVLHKNGLHFLPYDRFAFMLLCDEYAQQHTHSLCLHTHLCRATLEDDHITSLEALVYHQPVVFRPRAIVDTSGEAALGRILNLDMLCSDEYQASAQVFLLAGLPPVDAQVLTLSLLRTIQKGLQDGGYPKQYERLSVVPGSVRDGQALLKLGLPLSVSNNPLDVSAIELEARRAIREIVDYLKTTSDLFKPAWLAMTAPETGIRTGPRHRGRYILTENDVLQCRKSEDAVARGAWPIEHWETGKNPAMTYFNPDDYYDIPAGALRSGEINNLYFAGRNLSATDEAIASARVIGTCLATGYAAGRLAAGQARHESEQTAIEAIQRSLFQPR